MRRFFRTIAGKERRITTADPRKASADLRNQMLHVKPERVGISRSELLPNVWGVLMEFWIDKTLVTLVSLADGATSMYYSSGGGNIGCGSFPKVAAASREFIGAAEQRLSLIPATFVCTMPRPGNVSFHLLTFDGFHSIELPEPEPPYAPEPLTMLYGFGQEVITQIRLQVG